MRNLELLSAHARQAISVLLLTLLATGCALLPSSRTEQIASDEATPTPIPTAIVPTKPTYTVKKGEVIDEITFSGRITPIVEEDLFFRASGRVRTVFFKRNEEVSAGVIIAELEIDGLERALEAANLDLERSQVRLDEAKRELDYDREIAQVNLEMAQTQLHNLERASPVDREAVATQQQRVQLAKISVDRLGHGVDPLLENDLERATLAVSKLEAEIGESQIIAPFDGRLLSVSLTPGQASEAYRPVAVIADVANLEISADLISNQMDKLQEGLTVEVVLVSRPGVVLSGEIRRLPFPFGSGSSGTTVEDLDKSTRINVDESAADAGFELGDLVRVTAELERKDGVLWLPPQALRNFDGRRFAVIQDGDTQRRVDVNVGIETQERVEIEEGLEEGQTVVGQ